MKFIFSILTFLIPVFGFSQNPQIDAVLKKYNKNTVPYIYIKDLAAKKDNAVLLDAREQKEYNVSKIDKAVLVGHEHFDLQTVTDRFKNKQQLIVVYCSIGVRSEQIADKLKKAGYTNVFNLYGGIFEWKNQGYQVVDSKSKPTNKVHTYSAEWSKYLVKGEKVF
jgi:rhodanese-related sulfurtransferase